MKKIAIIIFLITVLSFASGCTSQADYDRLVTEYNDLVYEYNELLATHNKLVDDYNELTTQADYDRLVIEYSDLVDEYNELLSTHNELVDDYDELTVQFEQYVEQVEEYSEQLEEYVQNIPTLLEGAIVPPYLLVEGREVNLVFRDLDGNVEYWQWNVEALEASVIWGRFMREMDISDLEYLKLYDVASRFTTGSKYIHLEGQGNCLDFRPYIMEDIFEPIALEFFSRHSDDESKVREVWNMVTQLNTYCEEVMETPRLPLETLLLGGGDCEDLTILTASILKAMPAEWKVSLVYMDMDNPTSINKVNHVTVYVDTGKYKTFVESTNAETMCPWETVDGFYFEVQ